jgi:hypothetical protein
VGAVFGRVVQCGRERARVTTTSGTVDHLVVVLLYGMDLGQ